MGQEGGPATKRLLGVKQCIVIYEMSCQIHTESRPPPPRKNESQFPGQQTHHSPIAAAAELLIRLHPTRLLLPVAVESWLSGEFCGNLCVCVALWKAVAAPEMLLWRSGAALLCAMGVSVHVCVRVRVLMFGGDACSCGASARTSASLRAARARRRRCTCFHSWRDAVLLLMLSCVIVQQRGPLHPQGVVRHQGSGHVLAACVRQDPCEPHSGHQCV